MVPILFYDWVPQIVFQFVPQFGPSIWSHLNSTKKCSDNVRLAALNVIIYYRISFLSRKRTRDFGRVIWEIQSSWRTLVLPGNLLSAQFCASTLYTVCEVWKPVFSKFGQIVGDNIEKLLKTCQDKGHAWQPCQDKGYFCQDNGLSSNSLILTKISKILSR